LQRDPKSLLWDAREAADVLIHGYAVIDRARVWRVVEDDLPQLRAALAVLLNEPG
jgi:uncharacterized protein with HEPN domain